MDGAQCSTVIAVAALAAACAADPPAVLRRYDAHASQGVAVDARHIYAVSNSRVVKLDKRTGREVGRWTGDPVRFPHINSCAVIARELVCASSNYPATPMASTVEVIDPATMRLKRSIPLPDAAGSITWVDRRAGRWWVGFANYDGRGGEAGHDHTATALVAYDDAWRPRASWRYPPTVLARFAPHSTSGGGWGPDGRLHVTGHDRPELYALRVPEGGGVLEHVGTSALAVEGQAVAWDWTAPGVLYGVSRRTGEVVAMRPQLTRKRRGCVTQAPSLPHAADMRTP